MFNLLKGIKMEKAKYVVFDGMDGCGKGTQMKYLEKELADRVVFTREPGGPPLAEEIRKIARDNSLTGESTALFQLLLFWAAREESMHKLVMPALESGKHVFSDRGDSSTYAFQLHGEEHLELFGVYSHLRQMVFAGHIGRRQPDLYVIFDLPAEVALERASQDATREQNHFDKRDIGYYERVRDGFRRFAEYVPAMLIDATRTPEEVHRSVMLLLAKEMIIPEYAFIV